jgi:hypothetical protein
MNKTTYIFIAISIIILSGCHSPLQYYPNYLQQKDNFKDIVLATDYAFFHSNMDGFLPYDTTYTKKLSNILI